ncbi:MAG: P-loop NTPase [Deltaproteobacteria bacterium]|nr:P-loop NTPase [Deltaproteobacteria bacterium]
MTEIWAIGGGKGGIGKSFIISSMGSYLARRGRRVILVDADLGAANLHTFLGMSRPEKSLTDFFENSLPLASLLVDSGIDNLTLLAGAIHSMVPENIKYAQKLKFFRHIKKLEADFILLDLGAGVHFNTIDTFLQADRKIVVIVPEITAIENMYGFVKTVFFRQLMNTFGENGYREVFMTAWMERKANNVANLKQFVEYLGSLSAPMAQIIDDELCGFRLYIVLNQIRLEREKRIGNSVKSICLKYFGMDARYVGFVEIDDFIISSLNNRQPFMETYPESKCAREVGAIARNLLRGEQVRI